MRIIYLIVFLGVLMPLCTQAQAPGEAVFQPHRLENGALLIEDFEDDEVGGLPAKWYNRDGDFRVVTAPEEEKAMYEYEIRQEAGNKYLHYNGIIVKHFNYPLINKEGINIYDTPVLSWKWRAWKLPRGANEDDNSRNDTVASIYVVFDFGRVLFRKVPKSIRYTWSSSLPKGTELSKFFGNQKIVVVETGEKQKGKWMTFKRNIVEDYRRLFGDDPPEKPLAILIMSDGDSTNDSAIADYDDIMLLPDE